MRSEDVCGAWVRVHEEDSDEGLVLRSADSPLPSDCGKTISQPFIVALMTDLLDLHE